MSSNSQNTSSFSSENVTDKSSSTVQESKAQLTETYQELKKKNSFISRGELMKTMKFPENNKNLVIIPSNIKGTGFLRTCYDKQVLFRVIDEKEFM